MNWKNYSKELSNKPKIPFIVGPTASGKSDLALDLAKEINGEIISADSMQIYKEMDIGTAKPSIEERTAVPHHLVDFINPDKSYSVSDFQKDATNKIFEILEKGKTPIICGGTGLYINSISMPYNLDVNNTDLSVRRELEEIAKREKGKEELFNILKNVDNVSAQNIHPNNIKRVIRALEVFYVSGKPKSVLDEEGKNRELDYEPILFSYALNRDYLYNRINLRVDKMIENGLIEEAKFLDQKYSRDLLSMQAIGYKEFFDYFDNKISKEEAIENLKKDTRHFAKRQLTWFRKDKRINYIETFKDLL